MESTVVRRGFNLRRISRFHFSGPPADCRTSDSAVDHPLLRPSLSRLGKNGKILSVCSSPNTAANLDAMATPSVLTEPPQSIMLDPFCGTATTMVAALKHGRNSIGVELDTDYCKLAASRLLNETSSLFGQARFQIELKPWQCSRKLRRRTKLVRKRNHHGGSVRVAMVRTNRFSRI